MVTVRSMRSRDLAWVVPLEQKTFVGDPPWSEAQFRTELAGVPETRWYGVAEDSNGAPLGYTGVLATGYPGEPADLLTIAVKPEARRAGVGSALLRAALDEASSRRAGTILLDVRDDNVPAIAFYRLHGFVWLSTRRRYYADGTDGMVMRRSLPRG